jgi:hypothetical protein
VKLYGGYTPLGDFLNTVAEINTIVDTLSNLNPTGDLLEPLTSAVDVSLMVANRVLPDDAKLQVHYDYVRNAPRKYSYDRLEIQIEREGFLNWDGGGAADHGGLPVDITTKVPDMPLSEATRLADNANAAEAQKLTRHYRGHRFRIDTHGAADRVMMKAGRNTVVTSDTSLPAVAIDDDGSVRAIP